jgi:hypothetical protein
LEAHSSAETLFQGMSRIGEGWKAGWESTAKKKPNTNPKRNSYSALFKMFKN